MRNHRGQIPVIREEPEIACGSEEFGRPLSRFPLRGQAGAGGFPPRRDTLRGQPKALARIVHRLPPQGGCRPLEHPLRSALAQGSCICKISQI